ncbi:MAG: S-adenosyl-l-methionine hydroxide adenosyltransferase family protein [Flavobacteriales bacterium]
MGIITLTSDMGLTDHYVASVKASILSLAPEANVIDISHGILTDDIQQAAFVLRAVWKDFPIGTVHIIGVKSEMTVEHPHVIIHYMGHYFVGADNGIFSLLFDEVPEDIFEINLHQGEHWKFPMKGVFAFAAAHLCQGGTPEMLAKRTTYFNGGLVFHADIFDDFILGRVAHIDHYGNAYTNISRDRFERCQRGRSFNVQFKRSAYDIPRILEFYTETKHGERLAMWTSIGWLMIAINQGTNQAGGGASALFGLRVGDPVKIEFYDNPYREDDFS